MQTLKAMQTAIHQTAIEKGWWEAEEAPNSIEGFCAALHSYVQRAVEAKNNNMELTEVYQRECIHGVDEPIGVPIAFADVIIHVLDFCEKNKIDLENAIVDKMAWYEHP